MSDPGDHRSMRVLVTGADGFVGQHLQRQFMTSRITCRAAVRSVSTPGDLRRVAVGDIGPETDWRAALDGVEVVVHLAARAHILREVARDPRAEFMRVNAEGTRTLALAAAAAGVRRFIYASSVGVLGNESGTAAFTADSAPRPHNAYAESKLAGEHAARSAGLDVVVLRLPLVYGTGVRANFHRLLKLIDSGLPLPFGSVVNRRSLLNVWNLCDLIGNVLTNPAAKNGTWLVSDAEDLSTPELICRIALAMRREPHLVRVPVGLLRGLGRLTGRQGQIGQLCGSLVVDVNRTRTDLGWNPVVPVDEAIGRTVQGYLAARRMSRNTGQ